MAGSKSNTSIGTFPVTFNDVFNCVCVMHWTGGNQLFCLQNYNNSNITCYSLNLVNSTHDNISFRFIATGVLY